MKDFRDFFSDPNYAHMYARTHGYFGLVYIESEQDKAFWQPILTQNTTHKYKFQLGTRTNPGARSKTLFDDLYIKANPYVLIAVDSDFDYLAPQRRDVARLINDNPYVLQTFAYAVENLNLEADVRCMLLALYGTRLSDDERTAPTADARLLLDFLTPIIKSWPWLYQ